MAILLHILFSSLLLPFGPAKSGLPVTAKPHPFFISVTEIQQNTAEKTLEISCKFFADDFEETLEKIYKTHLDIASGKDKGAFDQFIPDYISRHLQLTA